MEYSNDDTVISSTIEVQKKSRPLDMRNLYLHTADGDFTEYVTDIDHSKTQGVKKVDQIQTVTIDGYYVNSTQDHFSHIESIFLNKEAGIINNEQTQRLNLVPVNCVCRATPNTLYVNGMYDKQIRTVEIDISELSVNKVVQNLNLIDISVMDNYLLAAVSNKDTTAGQSKGKIQVYGIKKDGTVNESPSATSSIDYQEIFYDNFTANCRIMSVSSKAKFFAYVGKDSNLVVMYMVGKEFRETKVVVPDLVHVAVKNNSIAALSKKGMVSVFILDSSRNLVKQGQCDITAFKPFTETPQHDGYVFPTIAFGSDYIVVSGINKKVTSTCIHLLKGGSYPRVLDFTLFSDDKRIFPISQLQVIKSGATTYILATEWYERHSLLAIIRGKLVVQKSREKFCAERIFGIAMYQQAKKNVSMIYGSSFFKKMSI